MSNPSDQLTAAFNPRLVTLHDGRPGLRAAMTIDIRAPGKDLTPSLPDHAPVLDFISSDATLDRYHETIVPAGWQLENYLRNPVFQNSHQYGDILFTLGKALITEVRTGSSSSGSHLPASYLFQRILFATDVNPIARITYGLYSGNFINAVSVGFIPIRWEDGTQSSSFRRKYLEQELLEVSAVSIPANPNALALAYKSGAVEKSDITETLDLLRALSATYTTSGAAADPEHRGAMPEGSRGSQLGEDPRLVLGYDNSPRPIRLGEGLGVRAPQTELLFTLAHELRSLLKL